VFAIMISKSAIWSKYQEKRQRYKVLTLNTSDQMTFVRWKQLLAAVRHGLGTAHARLVFKYYIPNLIAL